MSFFLLLIIIQTCSTKKTTNHIHKPLIGTVYLSENIIEPKNEKNNKKKQQNN